MASISSLAFIEPICAVKALAVRPAMRMAVSSTANSRRNENATRSTVKMVAPNAASTVAPRKATTAPTRKVSKATIGAASSPVCSICATTGVRRQRCGVRARRSRVSRMTPMKPSNCMESCHRVPTARPMRSSSISSTLRSGSLTGMQ
ncbi:hypothetical protein D3C81_1610830 [compost metagenome]